MYHLSDRALNKLISKPTEVGYNDKDKNIDWRPCN